MNNETIAKAIIGYYLILMRSRRDVCGNPKGPYAYVPEPDFVPTAVVCTLGMWHAPASPEPIFSRSFPVSLIWVWRVGIRGLTSNWER